jgi:hypothetical protein
MAVNEESIPLREVPIEQVAAYLRCDAQRLATALRRLTVLAVNDYPCAVYTDSAGCRGAQPDA